MDDSVVVFYASNLGPAIVRTLTTSTGEDWDITTGQQFRLRARERYGDVVLLDKVMTADVTLNTVTYQPVAGDPVFSAEGVYRAWVYYVNAQQDTDEFDLLVFSHAPGEGVSVGAIWRAARALEPVSWDSLRSYPDYGDVELQRQIDLAKLRILPSPVSAANEATLDPRVIDLIAKRVLVDNVLYAAISFWSNQVIQQTARGNSEEVRTYPDRIRTAENAFARYREDVERQLPEVERIIGATGVVYDAPAVSGCGPTLTPGLDEYSAMPISVPRYSAVNAAWLRKFR